MADPAVVRDVTGAHDVVVVSDLGNRLGLGAAGYGVVLADGVAAADAQITALARELLIEGIGAQHGARRDLIALTERGPSLDVDVRLEVAARADLYVALDHTVLADRGAGANARFRVDARGGRDASRWIDGHEFV